MRLLWWPKRVVPPLQGGSGMAVGIKLSACFKCEKHRIETYNRKNEGSTPMANRNNHYEAAFEAYLRSLCLPYIPSEENRRSLLADGTTIKNFPSVHKLVGKMGKTDS